MAAERTSGAGPDGPEPPRLPPGGRVSPAAPTVRVTPPGVPFTPRLPAGHVVAVGRTMTTRLAAAAEAARSYQPPAPLTNPLRHPLRWLVVTAVSLAAAVVFAHLAALLVTGLYYLIFEVSSGTVAWWHSVLPDAGLRHVVRDVAEGFYGGAIAQQFVWNPFTNRRTRYLARPMSRLDRLEDRLRIPNLRSGRDLAFWQIPYALAVWAPVYGSVGFTVTYLLDSVIRSDITAVQHAIFVLRPHASMWQRSESMDTAGWDKKVIGLAASFCFGRRPLRKVFDGLQLWSAERHVARGYPVRWYHPPTFRARCAQVLANVRAGAAIAPRRPGRAQTVVAVTALAAAAVLIAIGCYALAFAGT